MGLIKHIIMGKLKNGILGGFSGKVGNVVGVRKNKGKNRDLMRALPKKSIVPRHH
jgi:hypothetical protein